MSNVNTLESLSFQLERCCRCSNCKNVPLALLKSQEFGRACPSIEKHNFHAYSAGGRIVLAYGLTVGKLDYSDSFLDIVYRCQLDGACDVSCKTGMGGMLEPLEIMRALRVKCVEDGQLLPQHMVVIDGLRKEDNMMQQLKTERGKWAEGLDVKDLTKEKAEVAYHAGCRYSFDEELWPAARAGLTLLKYAGVDVGIMGKEEACCGGRAYEIGYLGELVKYADHNIETWTARGVQTVVTPCSDCYHSFKVLFPMTGKKVDFEVLHITQYLDRLIKEGKIKLTKEVPMMVTYHDPCHLGRLGEAYQAWEGVETKMLGLMIITEPEKPVRFGVKGVYDEPRRVLNSIPGLNLVEMERIKEYAWCCGAGGGVIDAYPDFSLWTALKRIEEAKATGAEALVTACPWCARNFKDAIEEIGDRIKVYDVVELVQQAI